MPVYNAYAAPSQPRPITAIPQTTQIAAPLAIPAPAAVQPVAVQPTIAPQPIPLRPIQAAQYVDPYQGTPNEEYNRFPEQPDHQNSVSGYEGDDGADDEQSDDNDFDDPSTFTEDYDAGID